MKAIPSVSNASSRFSRFILAKFSPALMLLLGLQSSHAGSATWKLNPASGDWIIAANWTPPTVPNGPSDTATFAASNTTDVIISEEVLEVSGIIFNAGASRFTFEFQSSLELVGTGITNNSDVVQTFDLTPGGFHDLVLFNAASLGTNINVIVNGGSDADVLDFFDTSTADSAVVTINGSPQAGPSSGVVFFVDNSSGGTSTFTANGSGVSGGFGSQLQFANFSAMDSATIIGNGGTGGGLGAHIIFSDDAVGGTGKVEIFGNATLDLILHNPPGLTIGSLEGDGTVLLGPRNQLTVGSNNLNTTFSGQIKNGGGLKKIGAGTLALTGANTYSGGTTISQGALVVGNGRGSGTGSGPVQVNGGMFGGLGTVTGAVTIGRGSGRGAVLAPGKSGAHPGTLTIQSALTFNSNGTYLFGLDSDTGTADQVVASGVTINNGAHFSPSDVGSSALSPGTVFTIVSNTTATPIAGTFVNLADGSRFTVGNNTFQVSYEGGDGNDLTLTVVP